MQLLTLLQNILKPLFKTLFDEAHEFILLAARLLYSQNMGHRFFSIGVMAINLIIIVIFIMYALASKNYDATSPLYENYIFTLSDDSLLETFGYCLEIFCVLTFFAIGYKRQQYYWYAWALIYTVIFFDDSYHFHEKIGHIITDNYEIPKHFSEIIGFASLGLSIAAFWLSGLFFKPRKNEVKAYFIFSFYLGSMIFFGVFVDAVHSYYQEYLKVSVPQTFFALAEDGMEQLLISLSAISLYGLWRGQKTHSTQR